MAARTSCPWSVALAVRIVISLEVVKASIAVPVWVVCGRAGSCGVSAVLSREAAVREEGREREQERRTPSAYTCFEM